MAINVPIVSEFSDRGLKKAMSEFKRLETTGQKTAFALKKAFVPATAALGGLAVAGAKMVAAGEKAATANARIEQIATSMGLGFGAPKERDPFGGEGTDRDHPAAQRGGEQAQGALGQAVKTLLVSGTLSSQSTRIPVAPADRHRLRNATGQAHWHSPICCRSKPCG